MQTLTAIAKRTSVREFSPRPIPKTKLEAIIDAGRLAPTARAIEPWEFILVCERAKLIKLGQVADHGKFIAQAGACIIVLCEQTKYYLEDGCAATENMLLAATDLGVASCWVAGDKKAYAQTIKTIVGAPESLRLVSMIALGFAQRKEPARQKRTLNEVLHWESF